MAIWIGSFRGAFGSKLVPKLAFESKGCPFSGHRGGQDLVDLGPKIGLRIDRFEGQLESEGCPFSGPHGGQDPGDLGQLRQISWPRCPFPGHRDGVS